MCFFLLADNVISEWQHKSKFSKKKSYSFIFFRLSFSFSHWVKFINFRQIESAKIKANTADATLWLRILTFHVWLLLEQVLSIDDLRYRFLKNHSHKIRRLFVDADFDTSGRGTYMVSPVLKLRGDFIKGGRSRRESAKNRISLQSRNLDAPTRSRSTRKLFGHFLECISPYVCG